MSFGFLSLDIIEAFKSAGSVFGTDALEKHPGHDAHDG